MSQPLVKVLFLETYTVKDGSDNPPTFEKDAVYELSQDSADHHISRGRAKLYRKGDETAKNPAEQLKDPVATTDSQAAAKAKAKTAEAAEARTKKAAEASAAADAARAKEMAAPDHEHTTAPDALSSADIKKGK